MRIMITWVSMILDSFLYLRVQVMMVMYLAISGIGVSLSWIQVIVGATCGHHHLGGELGCGNTPLKVNIGQPDSLW